MFSIKLDRSFAHMIVNTSQGNIKILFHLKTCPLYYFSLVFLYVLFIIFKVSCLFIHEDSTSVCHCYVLIDNRHGWFVYYLIEIMMTDHS